MARPITKKPRRADDYDNRTDGRLDGGRAPSDDFTLNPGKAVNLVRPNYKKGPIVFRPLPALDNEDPGQVVPGRRAAEKGAYSNWIVRMDSAAYIGLGRQKYTFLLRHPRNKEAQFNNPYSRLYYAAAAAWKAGRFGNGKKWDADWNKFMQGDLKGGAALSKPKSLFYCAALVYTNGEKNYLEKDPLPYGLNEKDNLVVIEMGPSGGMGLNELLDLRRDEFDGDEEVDYSAGFYWGDPVGTFNPETGTLDGGVFVTLFNPKVTKITEMRAAPTEADPKGKLLRGCSWDGKTIEDIQGYEVAVQRNYKLNGVVYRPGLDAEQTAGVISKLDFWFDNPDDSEDKGLLRIAPMEQQAAWVAKAFASAPELIRWSWSENPEFMTAEVKGILSARVSAVIPDRDEEAPAEADDAVPDDEVPDEEAPPAARRGRTDPTARRKAAPAPEEDPVADEEPPVEESEEEAPPEEAEAEAGEDVPPAEEGEEELPEELPEEEPEAEAVEPEEEPERPARRVAKKAADEEDEFAKPKPAAARPVAAAARKPRPAPAEDDEVPEDAADAADVDEVPDDEPAPAPAKKPTPAAKPAVKPATAAKPATAKKPATTDDYFEDQSQQSLAAAQAAKGRSAAREGGGAKPAPAAPGAKKPAAAPAVAKKPVVVPKKK